MNIINQRASLMDGGITESSHCNDGRARATPDKPFLAEKERALREFERQYFTSLLGKHHGNVSRTAREAGISRQNVFEKLKKLGIEPGLFR